MSLSYLTVCPEQHKEEEWHLYLPAVWTDCTSIPHSFSFHSSQDKHGIYSDSTLLLQKGFFAHSVIGVLIWWCTEKVSSSLAVCVRPDFRCKRRDDWWWSMNSFCHHSLRDTHARTHTHTHTLGIKNRTDGAQKRNESLCLYVPGLV